MAARPSETDKKERIVGERLARRWGLDVRQARYRETGDWYHGLRNFPAAFLDAGGYVEFLTDAEYRRCSALRIGPKGDVGVPDGIKVIPGYRLRPEGTPSEEDGAGGGAPDTFDARTITAASLAKTARATVAGSNGQQVVRTVKNKDLRFAPSDEFEKYIQALLNAQEGRCAITGLKMQHFGREDDLQLLCSLDRIDSNGHYERGNLQIVCRFVNKWKSDMKDDEVRRLIALVRAAPDEPGPPLQT